jgi:DNA-binding response OmpR family regulator
MTDDHRVLIVEDEPRTSTLLLECVRSLGMRRLVAATLEEVDVAIANAGFCCVLLDTQIPSATQP